MEEVEQLRVRLVEFKKNRQIAERFREKDLAKWGREVARLHQVTLDEIGSIAVNRRWYGSGQIRTYVLFGIMVVLVIFAIYVTGSKPGRSWMNGLSERVSTLRSISMRSERETQEEPSLAEAIEAPGEWTEGQVEPDLSIESVRLERERLGRWEEQLQRKERRVEMELVALSEMRDQMDHIQNTIDQEKSDLEKLMQTKESVEVMEQNERLAKLARLYARSKPKDAAALLEELDDETILEIIHRMREREALKIIQKMNRDQAKELLTRYAEEAVAKKRASL